MLCRHPGVAETRVTAWGPETAAARLAAYVVLGADASADADELRAYLRERLPEPMVPAAFVFLDSLPRLPHGKVDRRALPPPTFQPTEGASGPKPPRTTVEEILTGIWEEILDVDQVGVLDNFFELGGHSLMATRILSRIARVFGVELPLASLFESPTVASLAEQIRSGRCRPASAPIVAAGTPLVRAARAVVPRSLGRWLRLPRHRGAPAAGRARCLGARRQPERRGPSP